MFTNDSILKPKEPPYRCELTTTPDDASTKIVFTITNIDKYCEFSKYVRNSLGKDDLILLIECKAFSDTLNIHISEQNGDLIVQFYVWKLHNNYHNICNLFKSKELHMAYRLTDFSCYQPNYIYALIIRDINVF